MSFRSRVVWCAGVLAGAAVLIGPGGASAQEELPGIELGLTYASSYLPALAVQPFMGSFGGEGIAPQVEAIVGRDMRNSDRFEVLDSLPGAIVGEQVDYGLWDRLGAVWLVTGQVEGAGDGYVLIVELHDVVYGEVRERGRFRLPDQTDEDFRMAVHRTSDEPASGYSLRKHDRVCDVVAGWVSACPRVMEDRRASDL
jgi:hypothetical protein